MHGVAGYGAGFFADVSPVNARDLSWISSRTHPIRLSRLEILFLAALIVAVGLVLAFGQIAEEMLEGNSAAFDRNRPDRQFG